MNILAQKIEPVTPNFEAIKNKQQATWGAGEYGKVGSTLQITGEFLCESMDLRGGQTVLDVAAGNGNATIAAARRFCKVISTDYVGDLLGASKARADANGFDVDYRIADAECLPFTDSSFDHVISTFGVMFAPDQVACSKELLRVCKEGGTIGLANWAPEGFIGHLFKKIGSFVTPPAGINSPALWGTEAFLNQHFAAQSSDIKIIERDFMFRYQSPQHWLDFFGAYYGPVLKAFSVLPAEQAQQLKQDILDLIGQFNIAEDGTMVVPSRYLEVVITK